MKHKPTTPLPWIVGSETRIYMGAAMEKREIAVATRADPMVRKGAPQNAAYIAHACNAYPRLIEALRGALCVAYSFGLQATGTGEYQTADRLLRELGEDE